MDTAKVEIGKLQLLCDRINSMLDALNQVRLSVHGLQNSNVQATNGTNWQAPAPWTSWQATTPWQFGGPYATGMAHTSPWWNWQTPIGYNPTWFSTPWTANVTPWAANTTPWWTRPTPFPNGFTAPVTGTFTHSTGEPLTNPYLAARIATSFPYAFANLNGLNGQTPGY